MPISMSFARVESFWMWNSTVLVKMRLNISSGGKKVSCINSLLLTLSLSYAHSADALRELTRLIPNFQKKIDVAEPDDVQESYSTVHLKTWFITQWSFNSISSRMARRMHTVMMFLNWWAALQSGWTSNIPRSLACPPLNTMAAVSIILLLVCSYVPLDMTVKMKHTNFFVPWIESGAIHELSIGYTPSFVRQTLTMITLLTFAFTASIMVLTDPATTRRKGFYRAYCFCST